MPVIRGEAAKARVFTAQALNLTIFAVQPQQPEPILEPAGEVRLRPDRQPGAGAQLPRCGGMVGGCGRQGLPGATQLAPGLPETILVRETVELPLGIEARLLQ